MTGAPEGVRTMSFPATTVDKSATKSASLSSVWSLVKQTAKDWSEDNAMRLAAAMACYIMLALAPMIVVTLKVISVVPFLRAKTNEIVTGQVTQLVGSQSAPVIEQMVQKAQEPDQGTFATIV